MNELLRHLQKLWMNSVSSDVLHHRRLSAMKTVRRDIDAS